MARSLSFPATLSRNSFMANHTLSSICYRSTSSLLSLFPYKIDPFGKTEMFSQNYFMRAPFLSTISWGGCSHMPRYIPIWSGWCTSWWWGWSTSWWRGVVAVLAFLMVGHHQKKPIVAVCGTTLSEILFGLTQTYPCKKKN